MFLLDETNLYYLSSEGSDLSKGFTLMRLALQYSHLRVLDGSVSIFVNKSRTTLKLFHWEGGRFIIIIRMMTYRKR